MSSRERLLTAIRHQEADYVPVSPRLGAWMLEYYGIGSWEYYLRLAEEFDYDPVIIENPVNTLRPEVTQQEHSVDAGDLLVVTREYHTPDGTLREVVRTPKKNAKGYGIAPNPFHEEYLLKSEADLPKLQWLLPDPLQSDYSNIPRITQAVGEKALVAAATVQSDTMLMDYMGMENAMVNYKLQRDFFDQAYAICHRCKFQLVEKGLRAGIKVLFDSNYNFSLSAGWSPETWRETVKPKIKEICDLVHSYDAIYFDYDDGKYMQVLPDLVELGVDIMETCTPPPAGDFDLRRAKESFGDKICFKGYIDTVNTMRFGTPATIRRAVEEAMMIGKPDGGFILGTSDSIRDGTPLENVKAFFKTAREFGRY